ncbi:poly-gamma-glutamate hydrolase family protein [Nonomuraea angiospora]|uniref:poly-gamma-glutamate hydrolase family protein n=1 Tax=Nonomuraea angiospora TaxID=46172 RepID=UPI00343B66BE
MRHLTSSVYRTGSGVGSPLLSRLMKVPVGASVPDEIGGDSPQNIANRNRRGMGVQLEISRVSGSGSSTKAS